MVLCRNCRFCINDEWELKMNDLIYCYATDEYISRKCAEDDLGCEFYDEKLDDNETEESRS